MKKRDFLRITDLAPADLRDVLDLAADLKRAPLSRKTALAGRAIAIVMEKPSTRTRVSFEVGVAQLGGHPLVLGVQGSQLERGEPVADTARILERLCDLIVYRTSTSDRMTEMATARVGVINALTDAGHPCQVLADVFTMEESLAKHGLEPRLRGRRIAFVGDGSSNMARSFIEAARSFEFHLELCCPPGYRPPAFEVERAKEFVEIHEDPAEALRDVAFVHTDVWTSMGQEAETLRRQAAFEGYCVNRELMKGAHPGAIVLHCLPAHRGEEIGAEYLDGPEAVVWTEAENRLHAQKALLEHLLR